MDKDLILNDQNDLFILKNEQLVQKYKELVKIQAEWDELYNEIKPRAIQMMEGDNIKSVSFGGVEFRHKRASTRKSLDQKRLQEELPDIYEKYIKETNVSSTIVIKVLY